MKPTLLIFASGTTRGGGTGFARLVQASRDGTLDADIVGVVSNHHRGGVYRLAKQLGIRFGYFSLQHEGPTTYPLFYEQYGRPDFIALSGWLLKTRGLDPRITFNIHPAPLPRFGGKGMYGDHVHKAVLDAFRKGEIAQTAVTMHFVTDEYDRGPIFFEKEIPIEEGDTVKTLRQRVQEVEHEWQPRITQLVLSGAIHWNGKDPDSLQEG